MGCHILTGAKADTELQIVNDLMQEAINHRLVPKTAIISFKKRRRTPEKMLPFVVNTRPKSVKKQTAFRRRSDRRAQSSAAEGILDSRRDHMVRSISGKKKRKKKRREMRIRATEQKSVPVKNTHSAPKYHLTIKRVLEAYKKMRKGRCFYPSKRVLWKNRHRLILGSRHSTEMNDYMEYRSDREKEYDVPEPPDEEEDPQWEQTGPQYPSDDIGDGPVHRDKVKIKNPTLLTSTVFQLGMGPEFSSDIAGDGPRKSKSNEDEYDPEQERIMKRKTYNKRRSKSSRKADN